MGSGVYFGLQLLKILRLLIETALEFLDGRGDRLLRGNRRRLLKLGLLSLATTSRQP
jgi:hypothetical protein